MGAISDARKRIEFNSLIIVLAGCYWSHHAVCNFRGWRSDGERSAPTIKVVIFTYSIQRTVGPSISTKKHQCQPKSKSEWSYSTSLSSSSTGVDLHWQSLFRVPYYLSFSLIEQLVLTHSTRFQGRAMLTPSRIPLALGPNGDQASKSITFGTDWIDLNRMAVGMSLDRFIWVVGEPVSTGPRKNTWEISVQTMLTVFISIAQLV